MKNIYIPAQVRIERANTDLFAEADEGGGKEKPHEADEGGESWNPNEGEVEE